MNPRLSAFFPALLLLGAASLAGAQVPLPTPALNPYEGRVPVSDASAASRDPALRAALAQVLQRVAGPETGGIDDLVARASQLVQRYGYETDPETRQLQLVAAFDARAVDAQLRALSGAPAVPEEDVRMTVSGIDDARDYAHVIQLLKGLPGVSRVQVALASGSRLDLRLRAQGGAGRISGALLASGLTPEAPPAGAELAYRLR